jgi:hypothetical protein
MSAITTFVNNLVSVVLIESILAPPAVVVHPEHAEGLVTTRYL